MNLENNLMTILGLPDRISKPLTKRTPQDIRIAKDLFGFEPSDQWDPRWRIVEALKNSPTSRDVHRHVAFYEARHLSPNGITAYASEYGRFGHRPENIAQAAMAITNLKHLEPNQEISISGSTYIRFHGTTKVTKGTRSDGTTGCPEALHQLQLFDGRQYIGRVGYNLHTERGQKVITIANIQGAKGAVEWLGILKDSLGKHPLNFLVDFLKNMFPDATFLGVSNPKDPRATDLQNIVLKKTGIKRQPFTRK